VGAVYAISRHVDAAFEQALVRTKEALNKEGFGILCEIDVKDTFRKKLDVEFRKYVILGACNPPLAHQALTAELELGLLLPCNVIVYEDDRSGSTVAAIDARTMVTVVQNERLAAVAEQVNRKLAKVVEAV
jgi:uncharacterized protein (DUF302 family)